MVPVAVNSKASNMNAKVQLQPGEIILGNRLRQCYPARLRDEVLPETDEALVETARQEEHVLILDCEHARHWAGQQFLKLASSFDGTEQEMMRNRIGTYFQ